MSKWEDIGILPQNPSHKQLLNAVYRVALDKSLEVYIEYRGNGRWAVCTPWCGCMKNDGSDFVHEQLPSNRDEDYLKRYRFDSINDAIEAYHKYISQFWRVAINNRTTQRKIPGDWRADLFASEQEARSYKDHMSKTHNTRLISPEGEIVEETINKPELLKE